MNNYYNSDMYLKTSDLNNIENDIESITDEIQQNVFNNQQSPLRNIRVGDNLNGKTLYLSFPKNIYEYITTSENNFITTDNNSKIRFFKTSYSSYDTYNIGFYYNSSSYTIYRKYSNEIFTYINRQRYKLPYDFGIVTQIDTNNEIYQYVKIYDDENIIPDYEKHTWTDDEVLSMQKIDNIEQGVRHIGEYYYKPIGWVANREWLKTCNIKDYNNGTNKQNISYQDLNRWITNLSLIDFDDLENMCIWNSNISNLQWNKHSDTEWEEF